MKQKIVRLTTENTDGTFENYINDDLVLKKNSKISLLNVKCELENLDFVIDNTNDRFGLMLNIEDEKEPIDVFLETRAYNDTNFDLFLEEWQQKHNRMCNLNYPSYPEEVKGVEYRALISDNNEILFNIGYGKTIDAKNDFDTIFIDNINCDVVNGILSYTEDNTAGSYLFNSPLALGGGGFKFTLPAINTQDIIVGLVSDENLVELKNSREQDNTKIKYGFKYRKNGGDAELVIIIDGFTTVESFQPVDEGDEIIIMYSNGKIYITYFDGGLYIPIHEGIDYNHTDNLFGVIFMNGANLDIDVNNNNVEVYSSYDYNDSTSFKDSDVFDVNKKWFTKRIYFPDKDVLNDLGFFEDIKFNDGRYYLEYNENKPPNDEFRYLTKFRGNKKFKPINPTSSYIVELQNISLEFYDGLSGQRKNYILTFPNEEPANLTSLMYNTIYPIFINVKSVSDQVLRVIKARILREDGTQVNSKGLSIITLLIQEEE